MEINKRLAVIPFFVLMIIVILSLFYNTSSLQTSTQLIDTGDSAWMLMASALVLIMTPGLAFFYGGMVSKKNVISTMLQSFICMAVITILWVVVGFSLSFE